MRGFRAPLHSPFAYQMGYNWEGKSLKTKEVGWGTRDRTWDLLIQSHRDEPQRLPLYDPMDVYAMPLQFLEFMDHDALLTRPGLRHMMEAWGEDGGSYDHFPSDDLPHEGINS